MAPRLSVIMPAYNEEKAVERAMRSVLAQDYPADRLELIVVVGASEDRTREVVAALAREDARVKLLDNPEGLTPVALNRGVAAAEGDVVVRVDGHGWIAPGYLQAGIEALARTRADAVGGVVEFTGEGRMGRAIALAMGSRLGAGTAAFRTATAEVDADGIMWGVWPREIFDRVGPFDETLLRNQDDEFCHRIRLAGGRIVVTPTMRFSHQARSSLGSLWRQYRDWGTFRVATMIKHGRPGAPRQLIPPAIVVGLGLSALTEIPGTSPVRLGRFVVAGYAGAAGAAGFTVALRAREPTLGPNVSAAIVTMQIAYGWGFVREAARRLVRPAV